MGPTVGVIAAATIVVAGARGDGRRHHRGHVLVARPESGSPCASETHPFGNHPPPEGPLARQAPTASAPAARVRGVPLGPTPRRGRSGWHPAGHGGEGARGVVPVVAARRKRGPEGRGPLGVSIDDVDLRDAVVGSDSLTSGCLLILRAGCEPTSLGHSVGRARPFMDVAARGPAFPALQFRADSQDAARDPGDGGWRHGSHPVGRGNRRSSVVGVTPVPYVLVAVAVLVFIFGVTQLKHTESRLIPWGALLVWAALFFGGASVWMFAAGIH